MNQQIVNPQTGTELLPVPPAPLATAAPHASIDMRFDLDSIVAIGVDETIAALDDAKRKVGAQLETTSKYLNDKRRELADAMAEYGCPTLRADIEELGGVLQKLSDSARVTYAVDEPNRKTRVYTVKATAHLLRNRPLEFSREQPMTDDQKVLLEEIERTETRHGKFAAALAELNRRSNEQAITRKARAAAAKHVYSQSADGKNLVDALTESVVKSGSILSELLPGENL